MYTFYELQEKRNFVLCKFGKDLWKIKVLSSVLQYTQILARKRGNESKGWYDIPIMSGSRVNCGVVGDVSTRLKARKSVLTQL